LRTNAGQESGCLFGIKFVALLMSLFNYESIQNTNFF